MSEKKQKTYTNKEIIEELKDVLGHETQLALQEHLEVSKQSIYQFKNQKTIDINNKIATSLIKKLKSEK